MSWKVTEVCIAAFTRVASEGFLEEVTCGQRPNGAKEPALEKVGLEERGRVSMAALR